MRAAFAHVSTLNLGAHAFDAIKGFFQRRGHYPQVKLFIAEDNEAVIKILAKGRCPKLRHVARTHRVNLDWCYEVFRWPEVKASYVATTHQIADICTKAITKGETWERLISLMGIRAPGKHHASARVDVTTNKAGQKTSSHSGQPSIGQRHLQAQSVRLMSASQPLMTDPKPATSVCLQGIGFDAPRQPSYRTASISHPRSCSGCGAAGTHVSECLACVMAVLPVINEKKNIESQEKEKSPKLSRGKRRRLRRLDTTSKDQSFDAID